KYIDIINKLIKWGKTHKKSFEENQISDGWHTFDIAKNRNGACNSIPLYHNDSLTVIQEEKITAETVLNEPFE
ncbi:MAG: hypothetical protein M0R37_15165, partial [Bacteroidales bacterium]|nr:hypothetical protein [Bacteroidales bacterium]